MRVTIEHTTNKVSMFKSAPAIRVTAEFTDVEKAAIQKSGLKEYVVHQPPIHSWYNERMQGPLRVDSLLKGPASCTYDDLNTARADEVRIREALKNFKANIDANAEPLKVKDTFEL
jgi:hypothetical protein